jgi:hypothetical protein
VSDGRHLDEIESDTEEIDAIPVLASKESPPAPAECLPVPVAAQTSQPAPLSSEGRMPALIGLRSAPAQAAAVAAGGFVAGAAMVGLARRKRSGGGRRGRQGRGRSARERTIVGGAAGELLQIVGSRSLLVDVHLLGPASRRR